MRAISKVRIKYAKCQSLRFLSHLEVVSAIRQSVRRADLPVCMSSGFSPQLKIAFGPALAVGYTSTCEIFDMEMLRRVIPEEVKKSLLKSMPPSLEVLSISPIPVITKSIEGTVNVSKYSIELPAISKDIVSKNIQSFFNTKEFFIERLTDKSKREIDVRPLVIDLKPVRTRHNFVDVGGSDAGGYVDGKPPPQSGLCGSKIEMFLRFGPKKTAKPDVIIRKIFSLNEDEKLALKINRDEFFCETETGILRVL